MQARFLASAATGDVRFVEVFGLELTEDFSKVSVDEDVLAKLQGNPHVEVKAPKAAGTFDHDGDGKAGGSKPRAAEAAPEPATEA